jgi:uracil-DNA glycosylase
MQVFEFQTRVHNCDACADLQLGFTRPHPDDPFYKFPPIIGAVSNAPLLFVGINPRISDSNHELHEWLMGTPGAFRLFASNLDHRGRPYIAVDGPEPHYHPHAEITARLFPNRPFEDVAAATELFLCATGSAKGLPLADSPCADRYLMQTISLIRPVVIFAVGQMVFDALARRFRANREALTYPFKVGVSIVVPMHHLSARGRPWPPLDWTVAAARAVIFDDVIPPPPPKPGRMAT